MERRAGRSAESLSIGIREQGLFSLTIGAIARTRYRSETGGESNLENHVEIKFKKNHLEAVLPTRREGDSGWDVYAVNDIFLVPDFGVVKIDTGLVLASLTPGYELQARAKSGVTLNKHVVVSNGPGTIDNHYRGSICILMNCLKPVKFLKGEKFAQLVPMAVPESSVAWSEEVSPTLRGEGGFGSQG